MKYSAKIVLIITLFAGLFSSAAYACSCIAFASPEAHIEKTDVIFYGKAIRTTNTPQTGDEQQKVLFHEQSTRFSVTIIWKGIPTEQIKIFHANGNNCCYCGLVFKPQENYLIFANFTLEGKLSANVCNGTTSMSFNDYMGDHVGFPTDNKIKTTELLKVLRTTKNTKPQLPSKPTK